MRSKPIAQNSLIPCRGVEPLPLPADVDLGVELIEWPRDARLRSQLAAAGIPRLLVLDGTAPPPDDLAVDEDWIRRPFDPSDLTARLRRVAAAAHFRASTDAWLDEERVLHRGAHTAVLTAAEATVAELLLSSAGQVVERSVLEQRLWPDGRPPSDRAIDAVVYRLRRRCSALGLVIRNARGRGFVLLA